MPAKLARPTLAVALLIGAALLISAPLAHANDAGIRRVMKPYKTRLTVDIAYLSNFSAPSRKAAPAALRKLSSIGIDLHGASRALARQTASSANGRRGRADVLSALRDALAAASDAHSSAAAARAGHVATARRDAKAEQRHIGQAIPKFEAGGRLLHLF